MTELSPGLTAEQIHTVVEIDTAAHWGSGGMNVYSTPAMVGLMESTAYQAAQANLPEGQTTVGSRIDVRHLAATPMGMQVRVHAELLGVEGRKLTFKIQAWDELELIGEAVHERYLIDQARFLAKLEGKRGLKS